MVRLLDAMVAPRLEADGLAQWRTLSRFVRVARGREEAMEPGTTAEATPQTSETTETMGRDHAA